MTFYVENETGVSYDFSVEDTVRDVAEAVLAEENCPYEAQVNVLLTDNAGIREYNRQYRQIDRETDVLSFPNLEYEQPGSFHVALQQEADCFDPDSGELILGDIILSVDRIASQAAEYGHSLRRELAFLVAHSMLHLCGYDHMEPEEAALMEQKQEQLLTGLGITRDLGC
ncbi:MAG: rRNA maturation RNase YbeY [bacterium]|nr:rRNA maturation RNase YbeY [bacterium]MCM1376659.1 rRNA maturation RNase YbeY [Muribaculum sp.]